MLVTLILSILRVMVLRWSRVRILWYRVGILWYRVGVLWNRVGILGIVGVTCVRMGTER